MLEIQKWLKTHNFNYAKLKEELGIETTFHAVDERVILNYDTIKSPKSHPIVIECRNLTLNRYTGDIIARSFPRFFNYGEVPDIHNQFDWNNAICIDKHDGSLIKVYYYNSSWRVETRKTFGNMSPIDGSPTFSELVFNELPQDFLINANRGYSYIFEYCSMWNRIVRRYEEPHLYWLAVYSGEEEIDYHFHGLRLPDCDVITNIEEVEAKLKKRAEADPTWEGYVLRDKNNLRMKVKSATWFNIARMKENGNVLMAKYMIPLILNGDIDEVLIYFPEFTNRAHEVRSIITQAQQEVDNLWYCFHDEDNRKKFALAVKDHKLSGLLFIAKDNGGHPWDYINTKILLKGYFNAT